MKKKKNLSKIIQIWGLSLLITMTIVFTLISLYFEGKNFNLRIIESKKNYINQQKQMIKRQVTQVINLINSKRNNLEGKVREQVKERVYEAYSIAENIYLNNKQTKSNPEILRMIKTALRPIRFNKGNGYYFMTDLSGNELLFADKPKMEGLNLSNFKDSKGKFVIKDMIKLVKKSNEGYCSYVWTKPKAKGNNFKKIAFVKYFKPLNCFIGTGLYVDDVEKEIQKVILADVSQIRFGENGYIFINTLDGNALVSNGKDFSGDKKLWEIFNKNPKKTKEIFRKELKAAKKPNGDYIYYSFIKLKGNTKESPKSSFIKSIPEWNWLVGAGVYLDEVDAQINLMQKDFRKKILKTTAYNLLVILLAIFIFIRLFSYIAKKISNDLQSLISLLKKAINTNQLINRDKIIFKELDFIAKNINQMLENKLKAESDLVNERERLFVTIRSIGDGVITTDTKGRITLMNDVAEIMIGYKTEEVKNRKLEEIFKIYNSQTGKVVENPVKKVLEKGIIVGLANHTKLVSKDGKEFQIADSASPIMDSNKKILGVVLVFRDVTKEYELQNIAQTNEIKFKTIIEQSPISTLIFNIDGSAINANEALAKMWDIPLKRIVGQYNIFKDNALKNTEWLNIFKQTLEGKTVKLPDWEYQPIGKDIRGRKRILNCVAFPIIDNDKVDKIVLILKDVTNEKKAEEKLFMMSKLKSVGTLAGGIAHDFNNILTGIFGNISLAKMYAPENSNIERYLNNAEKSINRAVKLTKQLLVFSKGGSPVKENVSIKEIVREVAEFDLSGSNVKPIFRIEENLWNVKADKGQIEQVFSNLTINANQAMPNGGKIYFFLENVIVKKENIYNLEPGKYVKIMVKDEGMGISPDNLKKIFDPYFTTKEKGNGLGLATTYTVIQKHNGHIGIDSKIGKGTTFTIYLPATESQITQTENFGDELKKMVQSAKILIMDDEKMICELASDMIKTMGYYAETTFDGKEAIEKYKNAWEEKSPFDVVIMDLTIPGGMGGEEALKQILKINPDAKVVVSSGYSSGGSLADYDNIGFKGMIAKPYTMEKLQKILFDILAI